MPVPPGDPVREVANQAPPPRPIDMFAADLPLQETPQREGGGWGVDRAQEVGVAAGSAEAPEHGVSLRRVE